MIKIMEPNYTFYYKLNPKQSSCERMFYGNIDLMLKWGGEPRLTREIIQQLIDQKMMEAYDWSIYEWKLQDEIK